jgi:hypothetical protein
LAPKANIVSACVAPRTEGVEARSVMKTSRETVDWLSPVWSTREKELLRLEIGLDARHSTVPLSGENGEDFSLDIPSHRTHRQNSGRITGITDISRIGRFRIGDKLGVTEFKDRTN